MIGAMMYGTLETAAACGVSLQEARWLLDRLADIQIVDGMDAVYGVGDNQRLLHAMMNPYGLTPDRVEYTRRLREHLGVSNQYGDSNEG